MRILCFDIGGTGIKSQILDPSAQPLSERIRVLTPRPATPKTVLAALEEIAKELGRFNHIAAGFPGVVRDGKTMTAANLHKSWIGYDLAQALESRLGAKALVANDADIQGLGASRGEGLEMMITLGTGVGSALIYGGTLIPNLEMGHHPFRRGQTYEEQLGKAAFECISKKRWNQRVKKMIAALDRVFNYDLLFIGGGNAKHIKINLPRNVRLVSNDSGLLGCVRLWDPSTVIPMQRLKLAA